MIKEIQIYSLNRLIGIGFVLIFVLTACNGTTKPESTQELTQETEIQETQPELLSPTEIPAATITEEPTETAEGYPAPASNQSAQIPTLEGGYPAPEAQLPTPENAAGGYPSPELASPPPLKTELVATNPSTVNLSSGELQLVEFFAFW
jgi:hypothetical protein